MAPITRRGFVHSTAVAAAAFRARPLRAFNDARNPRATVRVDARAVRKLASQTTGQVITPDASEYETARAIFNRAYDRHPALIVRCASAADIARVLEFSQRHTLPVTVRGGGHNRAGLSVCDGAVMVDLSAMNRVEVDRDRRIAHAGAGALTVHVDAATQRFGLATTLAGCPSVGIAGLTLGGGLGFLMSKYGAACDNLMSAGLVTVDGRQVDASANSNPDLFWAIRGGGGNFGIATELEYRLHPLTDVLAGILTYPPGRVPEMLEALGKFVAAAPDELNVIAQILPSDQGPGFRILVCHCGDPRQGENLLRPLRTLKPIEERVWVAPYLQINSTINPAAPVAHFQTNLFVPDLSEAVISTLSTAANDAPSNTRVFMVPFYGAVTRVRASDTAFPWRSRGYELDIMGRWDNPTDEQRAVEWVRALRDKLRPLAIGAYVNQLGETGEDLVRSAYAANYSRLVAMKKKYDPNNVLRSNQNVRPS